MSIDSALFAKIYDELAPKIYKFCYFRVSSKEEAEDLASRAFLRAWDHLASGKRILNMPAFLYRVANNLIIDYYRKNKNKKELSIEAAGPTFDIPDEPGFIDQFDVDLTIKRVKSALDSLPENHRSVIIMKYINDLSVREIAQALGTSENNISVRLHRAIEKIKTLL